jgi:HEPN domain-containing protein
MNEQVRAWIDKAEGDFETAGRELGVSARPNYDAVCYHCQQCIEKLLKGALICFGVDPPYVHDIAYLTKLLRAAGIAFKADERDLRLLSQSAVVFRYPGENATAEDAMEVVAICERLRQALLRLIDADNAEGPLCGP